MPEEGGLTPDKQTERLVSAAIERKAKSPTPEVHWVWRPVGLAGSVATAGSVFLPWIPLRSLEQINLVELVTTLSRIGIPRMLWMLPLALGTAGIAATFVRHRTVRGITFFVFGLILGVVTVLARTDLFRAAETAAIVPLTVGTMGSGIYLYTFGVAMMAGAGLCTCWPSRTGRILAVSAALLAVTVVVVVPVFRQALPQVSVRVGEAQIQDVPARTVHVRIRNRSRRTISIVESPPAESDISVYTLSLSKGDESGGEPRQIPLRRMMRPEMSFPLTVREGADVEMELIFRPVWEKVAGNITVSPFAESVAGTYRISLSSSGGTREVAAEFVVEPVSHHETDAIGLLDEVERLIAGKNFEQAQEVARRLEESYPTTWAASQTQRLIPQLDAVASLDSAVAGALNVLEKADRLEANGEFAGAIQLIDSTRQQINTLVGKLPDNDDLISIAERLADRHDRLAGKLMDIEARRLAIEMQDAEADNDNERAVELAAKLESEYSSARIYSELQPYVERVLRIDEVVHRFELISIVQVGTQVSALLRDGLLDKQIAVRADDVIDPNVHILRIDRSAGTVLIEYEDVQFELTIE